MEEVIARSSYHPQQLGEQREEVIMTKTEMFGGRTHGPKT